MTGCPVTGHHAPALPVVPHRGVPTVLDPALGAAVMLDPATWSPAGSMVAHRPLCPAALRVLARAGFALPPALANNDTPSHPVLRGAVAPLLAARRVRAWRPRIAALAQQGAEEALAAARRDGEVDLAVVGPGRVPLAVMTELLGIGEGLPHDLLARSAAPALELFWGEADDSRQVDLAGACAELYRAIRAELRRVRAAVPAVGGDGPGDGTGPWADAGAEADGLLGRLVRAGCDDRVAASAAFFTVVAGHETTRWLVAGALARAAAQPHAWARLAADPGAATEEVLAHHSSVPRWRRTATTGATLGEGPGGPVRVTAGDPVAVELTGVGRPGSFAFGVGPHRCLGAELARVETEEILAATARTLGPVELRSTGPRVDLFSFQSPGAVRVAPLPLGA